MEAKEKNRGHIQWLVSMIRCDVGSIEGPIATSRTIVIVLREGSRWQWLLQRKINEWNLHQCNSFPVVIISSYQTPCCYFVSFGSGSFFDQVRRSCRHSANNEQIIRYASCLFKALLHRCHRHHGQLLEPIQPLFILRIFRSFNSSKVDHLSSTASITWPLSPFMFLPFHKFPWCSGYHVCLTRRRSPVRSRAETFLFIDRLQIFYSRNWITWFKLTIQISNYMLKRVEILFI